MKNKIKSIERSFKNTSLKIKKGLIIAIIDRDDEEIDTILTGVRHVNPSELSRILIILEEQIRELKNHYILRPIKQEEKSK